MQQIVTTCIYTSVVTAFLLSFVFTSQEQNSKPKVSISVQANAFKWNSLVPYSISVSDVEDGSTDYAEIPSNEVVLVAKYVQDSAILKEKNFDEEMVRHHDAVLAMSNALCLSCHAAKAKLIGPSFEQVALRYKNVSGAVEILTKKIIDGSTGNWSDLKMPPHPDLNVGDVKEMVTWILKNNSDPDFIYFVGTQGSLRIKEKPANVSSTGVYFLSASYLDHGVEDTNNEIGTQRKRGQHALVLNVSE